ncbi:MAG: DUF4367 domain-containing protein [Defluviitaleaceae bacterium]|nr:DUF4367 domain-containing protein [Defluviitaleaceae bacterium]
MREEEFIKKIRATNFASESKNKDENLEILKAKLPTINQERNVYMKRGFKKPIAFIACMAVILSMSIAVFGQDLVRYMRTAMLGNHAAFTVMPERSEEEIAALQEELQELIDAGVVIVSDQWEEPEWLTFTDAAEGLSHFITDAKLPTYVPEGFHFKHIFYFAESIEEFEEFRDQGANMYMGVVFFNGEEEIRMQIRYMTEDTGFEASASEHMRTMEINGYTAVVDISTVNLLIGDVLYTFFGMNNVEVDELIKMAESLG